VSSEGPSIETDRLLLRRWRPGDRVPFAALNADPEVMEFFPSTLTDSQSDAMVVHMEAGFAERGFGLWALEVKATGQFVGFTGLNPTTFEAPFCPAVEVGWRLARSAWGSGLATEAAGASLAYGFDEVGLDEIVSFTFVGNRRSRAVMERLGMRHDPREDFVHPRLVESPLAHHVLYRLSAGGWAASAPRGRRR
jgi:RimJ/RimL family protein N-acetyltransferase